MWGVTLAVFKNYSVQEFAHFAHFALPITKSQMGSDLVRDDLGEYVVEHLADDDAVLVVDENGFLKKGNESAGVQR